MLFDSIFLCEIIDTKYMNTPIKEAWEKVEEEKVKEPKLEVDEEKQIFVHCKCNSHSDEGSFIRIWQTTFLIDQHSQYKSNLLFAYNITLYPEWKFIPRNSSNEFTLVFGGLPKSCKLFDLIEIVDGTGSFEAIGIKRNKEDVYNVVF